MSKNNSAIYVTKSFMPPIDEYVGYVEQIYKNGALTNQGPLLCELEKKLKDFLEVDDFQYLANGTVALEIALEALDIDEGEVITTPFSYVATVSSIMWKKCKPVFCDIEPNNFTIDVDKIEALITKDTKAIMPVHVFGFACDVEKIEKIAQKHNLKVIYDGAHAFGVKYKGRSLLSYGDVSTLSFHATKLFHTIEGGACVVNDADAAKKLDLVKRFGHDSDNHICLGINAKANEFQAAMGLANFKYIKEIIAKRKTISDLYDVLLNGLVQKPKKQIDIENNYAYYPVVFASEEELRMVLRALNKINVFPRRYFHPSLNTLNYLPNKQSCPISEDIASRIACLPFYPSIAEEDIKNICNVIGQTIKSL